MQGEGPCVGESAQFLKLNVTQAQLGLNPSTARIRPTGTDVICRGNVVTAF